MTCQFGHPVDNPTYNPKYTISRPRSVTQTRIVCVSPSTKVRVAVRVGVRVGVRVRVRVRVSLRLAKPNRRPNPNPNPNANKVSDTRQLWVALNDNGVALNDCADPVRCGRNPTATNLNFTYYDPPTVVSVMPQAGVFSGDTVVTLLGQGFHGLAGNPDFAF